MGRYSLNICLYNKTKMKIILLACLLSCLLDSTFGIVTTFECDGETGILSQVQDGPGGINGYKCSIGIGGNQAEGKYVCDRLQEIDDICDYFKPRKPSIISGGGFGSFGSFEGFGSGILTGASIANGPCEYNCKQNGGCEVSRAPGFKGSCFSARAGGSCLGTPPGCTECGIKCQGRRGDRFTANANN